MSALCGAMKDSTIRKLLTAKKNLEFGPRNARKKSHQKQHIWRHVQELNQQHSKHVTPQLMRAKLDRKKPSQCLGVNTDQQETCFAEMNRDQQTLSSGRHMELKQRTVLEQITILEPYSKDEAKRIRTHKKNRLSESMPSKVE